MGRLACSASLVFRVQDSDLSVAAPRGGDGFTLRAWRKMQPQDGRRALASRRAGYLSLSPSLSGPGFGCRTCMGETSRLRVRLSKKGYPGLAPSSQGLSLSPSLSPSLSLARALALFVALSLSLALFHKHTHIHTYTHTHTHTSYHPACLLSTQELTGVSPTQDVNLRMGSPSD